MKVFAIFNRNVLGSFEYKNIKTKTKMKSFYSSAAPEAIGPYSQAIQTGNLLYCSGQTPIDSLTMKIAADDMEGRHL